MKSMYTQIVESADTILGQVSKKPRIGLILGSGLGMLADQIENPTIIPYNNIPHFPVSTVEGHAGQLVVGSLENQDVVAMQGRFHLYEGLDPTTVTFPVRVMKKLGVETILITNAAGGINETYSAGDLMLISDHMNLMYKNPLIGPNDPEMGERFPDMSNAYDLELRNLAHTVAKSLGFQFREGVYAALLGPTYETPAEIRMLRHLGADAVGMSTVPEVIVARHSGIKVLGISCITNMAAGILPQALSHDEVIETANRVKSIFVELVKGIISKI